MFFAIFSFNFDFNMILLYFYFLIIFLQNIRHYVNSKKYFEKIVKNKFLNNQRYC